MADQKEDRSLDELRALRYAVEGTELGGLVVRAHTTDVKPAPARSEDSSSSTTLADTVRRRNLAYRSLWSADRERQV